MWLFTWRLNLIFPFLPRFVFPCLFSPSFLPRAEQWALVFCWLLSIYSLSSTLTSFWKMLSSSLWDLSWFGLPLRCLEICTHPLPGTGTNMGAGSDLSWASLLFPLRPLSGTHGQQGQNGFWGSPTWQPWSQCADQPFLAHEMTTLLPTS